MSAETSDIIHEEHFDPGDEFWDQVRSDLIKAGPKKYYQGDRLVKDIEGEVSFANNVVDAVKEAVESGGKKIHLLLDIDNTIGAYNQDWEKLENRTFVIRPVFKKLLEKLKEGCSKNGASFDVGFISNREASHSLQQLNAGGQFSGFAEYVNKDLIFSSRHERVLDRLGWEDKPPYLKALNVVDPSSPVLERYAELNSDGYDKLTVLDRLKQTMQSDERLVVADDSPIYPELLNKKAGMYGVNVRDKGYYSRA